MRLTQNRFILVFLLLLGVQPALQAQLPELGNGSPGSIKAPHLTAELISDADTIAPGSTSRVALSLALEPGWHVYWVNAGDSGEAPRVQWTRTSGLVIGPMQFPAPSRLPLGPLMDYGYEGVAVFPFAVKLLPDAASGACGLDSGPLASAPVRIHRSECRDCYWVGRPFSYDKYRPVAMAALFKCCPTAGTKPRQARFRRLHRSMVPIVPG